LGTELSNKVTNMARIVLAMSGGVDSSVAAHLLVQQGHDVIGVFMRHGEKAAVACSVDGTLSSSPVLPILQGRADHKQGCCSASDAADARMVADRLGIPFYALNLEEEFKKIVDYFVAEYTVGRTPNPCVQCNNWIKFGKLFHYADSVGAQYVATGHYARLVFDSPDTQQLPKLIRGRDDSKDQSYVLFGIQKPFLRRMMLPIGDYEKTEIRRLATEVGLRVAEKKDSQEICFVTNGHHDEFVKQRRDARVDTSGNFVDRQGNVLGRHQGIERFTIGQRKGLGIAMGEPIFVTRIDPISFDVVLGSREELGREVLTANRTNWLIENAPAIGEPFQGLAQIRYNTAPAPARIMVLPDDRIQVEFLNPVNGVAPGQAVVIYDGPQVLGGGWIE
jgi:tRNA-uridine 2-sulfurtransferase